MTREAAQLVTIATHLHGDDLGASSRAHHPFKKPPALDLTPLVQHLAVTVTMQ
jgi:hypothetical protein